MHQTKEAQLQATLKRVQYLKGTPRRRILFKRNKNVSFEAYTNIDFVRSIVIGDEQLDTLHLPWWKPNDLEEKKQSAVARSSAEAEFRAMAQEICLLLWLKITLKDLKIKCDEPMRIYCNNKFAISITHNLVQHDRTKHIKHGQTFY